MSLQAMNWVQPVGPHQKNPFGATPVAFRSSLQQTISLEKEQFGPLTDSFKNAQKPAPATTALSIRELLTGKNAKANALALYEQVTGVKVPGSQLLPKPSNENYANIRTVAENIKGMSAEQKVDLMKKLTGPESPFSKISESILVNQQAPSMREIFNTVRDRSLLPGSGITGISAAFQSAALGFLMLPIVCPAFMLFRPELLGQVIAGAAALAL